MQRTSHQRPGYDCIRNPCGRNGCGTVPGASHGIHCADWIYVVADEQTALALVVFSGIFPESVDAYESVRGAMFPMPAHLTLHTAVPAEDKPLEGDCEYLPGGRCRIATFGYLAAQEFWDEHAGKDQGFDQPESFWLALESLHRAWTEAIESV